MTHEPVPHAEIDPLRVHAEQLVGRYTEVINDAISVGYPECAGDDPTEIFPEPTNPRSAAEDPGWDMSTEERMREVVGRLGYGRETDCTLTDIGMGGADVIIEEGQPGKVRAELETVLEDEAAQPSSLILTGSTARIIENGGEKADAQKIIGHIPETAYESVRAVVEGMPGFVPLEGGDQALPFAYDPHNGFAVTVGDEVTTEGQFMLIGHIGEKSTPVIMMDIHRDNYIEDGKPKYRNQPQFNDVMKIVSDIRTAYGDKDGPVAFVTSATYEMSRQVAGVSVGLVTGRPIGVATYGTRRLATVRNTPHKPPARNQIPGELHVAAKSIEELKTALREAA